MLRTPPWPMTHDAMNVPICVNVQSSDAASNSGTLTMKDGRLYAQRGNGAVLPLQVTADGRLHFDPDELSYFVPVREPAGRVVRLDYYQDGEGPAQPLPRVTAQP